MNATSDYTVPDTVRAALWMARHGMRVHPLRPDQKAPLWNSWEDRATTDPDVIRSWPRQTTGYGIAAGASGLYVIDCDVPKPDTPPPPADGIRDGLDMLAYLAEEAEASVDWNTFQTTTARGGNHLFYLMPPGMDLRNTAFDPDRDPSTYLGWLIDTRGIGGYVVGPGSVVGGKRYRTLHSGAPAPLPAWIIALLTRERTASQGGGVTRSSAPAAAVRSAAGGVGREWVEAALSGELARITSHSGSQGGRNHLLNQTSYTVGRLVGAGLLDRAAVAEELLAATTGWWGIGSPPFTRAEAEKTIESGLAAGERNPRTPAPRQARMRKAA